MLGSKGMAGWLPEISVTGAARLVGVGMLVMLVFGILAEFVAFSALIAPGDPGTTVANIEANWGLLGIGLASYAVILTMDVLVAWGLYVVLRPSNRELSRAMAGLRLVYTGVMAASLVALPLLRPEAFVYGQLLAYVFFIAHLFLLGVLVYRSEYIHRAMGALLVTASLCYVFLTYGDYVLSQGVYDAFMPIAMVPAFIGELGLGLLLLWRARRLPQLVGLRGAAAVTVRP